MVYVCDIGVSYFLVGVMVVLIYYIVKLWCWGYFGVLLVIFGFLLIVMDKVELDFIVVGYFVFILIGLLFYLMVWECDGWLWNLVRIKSLLYRCGI